ncbi:MAG: helix-turn-helix transcriptional regulator [Oscillospiraceae bacterium]|nr:helix-turn-helix transcriptional regulator [Ruminococcus sp.]MDE5792105.1 helix-turn-helix transcriptional regulator [Oscillospiraceae bacterium]
MIKLKLNLDKILEEKHMTRYQLAKITDIKYQTIDNYYKNRVTRYDGYILSRICEALDCEINDVLIFVQEEKPN